MKKKLGFIAVITLVMFICLQQVSADVVTTRKLQATKNTQTQQNHTTTKQKTYTQQSTLEKKLTNCIPYTENQTFDIGGVNFKFKVNIAGWINNKCRLDFEAKTDGIASSFGAIYGFEASEAEEIRTFAPKIRCEFTKQQLTEFGDVLLQEEERQAGLINNMLKNPAEVEILPESKLSNNDQKLFDMLMNTSTCQIVGAENLNNVINSIFGY
ncbi:MAG: hypothetical protein E7Z87_05105 [Cyanobacteria bacterium SIG26]|nr:hypothetical protein [Cyanobacteria bacterium SIG26]